MAAFANAVMWIVSIAGLIVVMRRCPSASGLFVILAGGLAIGVGLLAIAQKRS